MDRGFGGFGGAIRIINGSLDISGATFRENAAYSAGGAVKVNDSALTIRKSNFIGNAKAQYTKNSKKLGIAIRMDGCGRCRDNARMERFRRTLKYENIKLNDSVSQPQLRRVLQCCVFFYNGRRFHSDPGCLTPDPVYEGRRIPDKAS